MKHSELQEVKIDRVAGDLGEQIANINPKQFMCALGGECVIQCFTCEQDQKCDEHWNCQHQRS